MGYHTQRDLLCREFGRRDKNLLKKDFFDQANLLKPFVDFFYLDVLSSIREVEIALNVVEKMVNAINFYETPLGKKLIKDELITRRALKNEIKKIQAKKILNQLKYFKPNRLKLYQKIIEENNYIEDNISSSMNSNLAFYQGYSLSLPSDKQGLLEAEIISKIWKNENETRERMTEWVLGFTAFTFKDLTSKELNLYLEFSESTSGKLLNNSINYILDKAFEDQSYKLGQAFAILSEQGGA